MKLRQICTAQEHKFLEGVFSVKLACKKSHQNRKSEVWASSDRYSL